ncbi:34973_t:CDS:2 [Gigaspora margarita]|uniref:34973_t:CDS:1 n=1 Tax=Gigaspora margarita TaxID=4874 RepID=A0ABN7WJX7_GIGMA|nr:34973_t:CDS:2 [Gigaspora margarita]
MDPLAHLILIVPLQNNIKKELTEALKKIVNNEDVKKDVEKISTGKIDTPIKLLSVKPSEDTKKELSKTENILNKKIKSLKKELKDIEKEKSYTKNINEIIDLVKKSSKNKLDSNLKEQTLKNINWLKNKLNGIIFEKDELNEIIKEFSIENCGKDRIDYLSNLFKQHLGNKKMIENLIKELKKKQAILALENENSIINKNIQELKIQLSKEEITKDEKNRINTLINKFNGKISNNKIEKDVIEGKSIEPDEIKPPEFLSLSKEEEERLKEIDNQIRKSKSFKELEDKEKLDLEIDFICNKNLELRKEFDKLRRTRRDHVKLYEQLLKEINDPNVKIDDLKHDKGENIKKLRVKKLTRVLVYEKISKDINQETDIKKLDDNKEIDAEIQKLKQDDDEYPDDLINNLTKERINKKEKILETNKYNILEENINGLYEHPQSLLDAVSLDIIKKLNNEKLLDNKRKEILESLYNKKLSELNKKVMNEEKEKYNKIEKMINEYEDPVLLDLKMFNEIFRLINTIDKKIIGRGSKDKLNYLRKTKRNELVKKIEQDIETE